MQIRTASAQWNDVVDLGRRCSAKADQLLGEHLRSHPSPLLAIVAPGVPTFEFAVVGAAMSRALAGPIDKLGTSRLGAGTARSFGHRCLARIRYTWRVERPTKSAISGVVQ